MRRDTVCVEAVMFLQYCKVCGKQKHFFPKGDFMGMKKHFQAMCLHDRKAYEEEQKYF